MKTLAFTNRTLIVSGACAGLAIVAMGFAGNAHARDNLTFSVSVGGPNVLVGAGNAYPVYSHPPPVYVQPRPVYLQAAPVYYQPAPVYYSAQPVYVVPQQGYYAGPQGWKRGHYINHRERFNQGYAPVYYQR